MSLIAVSLLAVSALFAQDAPAGDDVVTALQDEWAAFLDARRAADEPITQAVAAEWAAGALADVDVTTLSSGQIEDIGWMINMVPAKQEVLVGHLETLSKEPTGAGLQAAVLLARQSMRNAADLDMAALLSHPGLDGAVDAGEANSLFTMMRWAEVDAIAAQKDRLLGYTDRLIASDDSANVLAGAGLAEALAKDGVGWDKAKRNATFDKAAAALDKVAAALEADDDRGRRQLISRAKYLRGPASRGELVGGQAPNIEYIWTSDESGPKSLHDHKGKVVVVDFWATWCGPCIRSFPQVRELQARYDGMDVVIVGVTSVQGTHYGTDGQVDVEGKPEEEFKLMKQFMGEKDITWDIAFSKEDAFNPMYGVNGIPHVVIIDTEGRVVENGLHPGIESEHKYDTIDELLKKAGKRYPEPKPGHVPHDHDGDGVPDH